MACRLGDGCASRCEKSFGYGFVSVCHLVVSAAPAGPAIDLHLESHLPEAVARAPTGLVGSSPGGYCTRHGFKRRGKTPLHSGPETGARVKSLFSHRHGISLAPPVPDQLLDGRRIRLLRPTTSGVISPGAFAGKRSSGDRGICIGTDPRRGGKCAL